MRRTHLFLLVPFLLLACAFAAPTVAVDQTQTNTVTLVWDPNSETDLAGYRVYWGTATRTYGTPVTVASTPTNPTYTVTGLTPGRWFFAVTAYNTAGMESGYSNEVSASVMTPPTGLRITSQSASLRWFGVVLLASTNENASAIFRYRKIEDGALPRTIIATPSPIKTQHRAVLYFPSGQSYYEYEWTMTSLEGETVTGTGTFQTR